MHTTPTAVMDTANDKSAIAFIANEAAYNTSAVRKTVCTLKAMEATVLVDFPKRSSKYCKNIIII